MRQLIGICGSGLIGTDPWDPQSWSGSSPSFFGECRDRGLLKEAVGIDAPFHWKGFYALRNYLRDSDHWKRLFYMEPGYRRVLTREVRRALDSRDGEHDILQLGAMYNAKEVVGTLARCYSYNDGNFYMGVRSPYFPKKIPAARIEATLDYERGVNASLDRIFTMSEYLRKSFIDDYGIAPEKVVNIGAGINLPSLPAVVEDKDYESGSILFIGADFYRKGGRHLLDAFRIVRKRVGHAALHIVGPSRRPEGVRAVEGVAWHGFLRKDQAQDLQQLRRLFEQASVFVMPSLYEPFGIAPLEAMAHMVPCVVTDDWALPEIVPSGVCGENVECGNVEQLAETLIALLRDPARLQSYGIAGRRWVEERYTWPRVVDRLVAALDGPV